MPDPEFDDDDDELARLMRAIDPLPAEHTARYEATQERVWARIVQTIDAQPASRGRLTRRARVAWGVSLPAVAVILVALVVALVVNPFTAPAPAAAEGLPALQYEASGLTLEEQLDQAREQLATSPGPAEPKREATTVAWYAHIQMDGPDRGTVISPEVMTITWDETLEMRIVVTAGRAYVVGGDGEQPPTRDDLPAEGTVLRDDVIPAEMNQIDGQPLPFMVAGSGIDFYRAYIAEQTAMREGGAAEALMVVEELLNNWTLTNEQEADILTVLGEYDGLELLGVTEDRAGRSVFGISAVTAPGYHREVLLVSTETGRILGSETIYLGDDPDFPLPTGSVMSYQMWDLDSAAG